MRLCSFPWTFCRSRPTVKNNAENAKSTYDQISAQDNFTALPLDLHLRIYSQLTYDDAQNLSLANKKFLAVSNHRDCRRHKTESAHLIISRTSRGYIIQAKCGSMGNLYQFFDLNSGNSRFIREKAASEQLKLHEWRKDEMRALVSSAAAKPPNMLSLIPPILKRFSLKSLLFRSMNIDASFLDQCQKVFKGIMVEEILFSRTEFTNDHDEEYSYKFTEWLASMKPQKIYFGMCNIVKNAFIDAHFLRRISDAANGRMKLSISFHFIDHQSEDRSFRARWLREVLKMIARNRYKCRCELNIGYKYDDEEYFGPEFELEAPLQMNEPNAMTLKKTGELLRFVLTRNVLVCENMDKGRWQM